MLSLGDSGQTYMNVILTNAKMFRAHIKKFAARLQTMHNIILSSTTSTALTADMRLCMKGQKNSLQYNKNQNIN